MQSTKISNKRKQLQLLVIEICMNHISFNMIEICIKIRQYLAYENHIISLQRVSCILKSTKITHQPQKIKKHIKLERLEKILTMGHDQSSLGFLLLNITQFTSNCQSMIIFNFLTILFIFKIWLTQKIQLYLPRMRMSIDHKSPELKVV